MSAEALGVAWALDDVTPTQKYVAIAVAWLCREEHGHECFPSWGFLAERTKLGETTCREAVRELVGRGVMYKRDRERDDGGQTSNFFGFTKLGPPDGSRHPPCRLPSPMSKESSKASSSDEDDAGDDGLLDRQIHELAERGMPAHRIRALLSKYVTSPTSPVLETMDPDRRMRLLGETLGRLLVDDDLPSAPFIESGIKRTLGEWREREGMSTAGKRLDDDSSARWAY